MTRAIYSSIFAKKYIEKTLTITGGGRGIKFEVANLDNLTQPSDLVTTLEEWSVKCWVVTDDDPTYMFARIYPVSPEMSTQEILTNLTILDDAPTQIINVFRLPAFVRKGQTMTNMAIRIKFRGALSDRITLSSAVYHVRSHTLPVLRCTHYLLFGHSNACNGKNHCWRCSGYYDSEVCSRPESCFFCDGNHRPIYRQCPAYLQALQLQQFQHHTITEVKRKLRDIRPRSFRPIPSGECYTSLGTPTCTCSTTCPSKTSQP